MATHDGIKLMRTKLEQMDIDDLRDVAGDDEYSSATRRMAQELVDRHDYEQG